LISAIGNWDWILTPGWNLKSQMGASSKAAPIGESRDRIFERASLNQGLPAEGESPCTSERSLSWEELYLGGFSVHAV